MVNEFYTLLTDKGMAKIASALADKKQIHLQKMAVGDSNGQYYEPIASQTELRHEVWRGEMNTLTVAPNNPNWLIAEVVLPEDVGGWYVREVGVFDVDGELIAIGKFPESYKPLLPGGSGKQVCIRLIMEVSNTTAVTLTVDPSVVLATRDYVDTRLDEHENSTHHPDATLTQKGFTQLSNATDSDDETKAATPKAVKAAMIEARNHTHTWNQITGIPDGTLIQKGIVKLNASTKSTSTSEAATPSAVKEAMDKANAAAPASHTHPWNQISGVPDGTLTQKGIVKLNNATNSTSTTEAATPSAVKAAMDKANAAAPANHSHTKFFTTNGTFTVPAGVTTLFVEVMGGGGGGNGGEQGPGLIQQSDGGGCGEIKVSYLTVTPGEIIPVNVGAGGIGGKRYSWYINGNNFTKDKVEGSNGGSSSFKYILASGGLGGGFKSSKSAFADIFYPGMKGENSLLGSGGEPGTYSMDETGKVTITAPSNATGYGAGGAGGTSCYQSQSEFKDLTFTNGTNGSPGFVKISW
ncbi:phage tail protein [Enterobacter sp. 03-F-07-AD-ECC]|uniref:phage tail-collar fiber domain-containing protein n=1 Tax=Enterobacter sp. 03-F-07-AD-ECC TaxID=3397219 RepID=UPI0039DF826E